MLTESMVQHLIGLAGPDFTWTTSKSSRPHTDIRTGLREFLWNEANGECVFCEESVSLDRSHMCHIVSSGGPKVRRGYVPSNLALGCADCNARHSEVFGDVVPYAEIARPDRIPAAWPSNVDLRNRGRLLKALRNAA
jgi:5-methylcytosine-specific restriction endonuclease McrA